ncbi:hypothetical protein PAL_GLEAN10007137 [Pteropus alecto]|uniref:Uncharacterized protein n=1 Tax=Pteropus alecto TaxID=9402 RepID=L5KAY9_PTEAL|nr:hypothetical protein PAL_GLEAN10007137 [Pteropus alecto]
MGEGWVSIWQMLQGAASSPDVKNPQTPGSSPTPQALAQPGPGLDLVQSGALENAEGCGMVLPDSGFYGVSRRFLFPEWDRYTETPRAYDLTRSACSGPQERRARTALGSLPLAACCHTGQSTVWSRGGLEISPQPSTAGFVRPASRLRVRRPQPPSQRQNLPEPSQNLHYTAPGRPGVAGNPGSPVGPKDRPLLVLGVWGEPKAGG